MNRDSQRDRMVWTPRNAPEDSQNRVASWLQQSRQQRGGSNPSNYAQGHSNWGASQSHHYGGSNRNSNAHGYPNWGPSPQEQREPQSVQRPPMNMSQRPSGQLERQGNQNWSTSPQQPHHSNRHVPQGNHGLNRDEWTPNPSWISWTSSHVVHDDGFGPCLYTQWHPERICSDN